MSNLNDTSMNPQGVEGAYPGVANPTSSSTPQASDAYASVGDLSAPETGTSGGGATEEAKDVIEGKPGVIESAQLAPLGDDKVASDPGLVTQATILAQQAYDAVLGEKK